jgi:HAD superfamily hydrolase (TIGR01509 family)
MIRVIAFDLDDTLWHVHPVIVRAEDKLGTWLSQQVPQLQYDVVSMRQFREQILKEDPSLGHRLTVLRTRVIESALLNSDIPENESKSLAAAAMEVFLTARNEVAFFDGAIETIEHLAGRFELGALTNGNADIHRLGLAAHFGFAFSAEQVGAPKPAPDLFHAALEHTGCRPEEVVYVGDDPFKDVDAAKSVGLHTIWCRNDARPGPGETAPDQIIDQIRELPEAINQLLS